MKRRDFIHSSSILGASLSSFLLSCTANKKTNNSVFEFEEKSIAELKELMESGSQTSESITEQYINRIEEIDKDGYQLNSVIIINPDALEIARQLDKERNEGKIRGALHGIPVLLKDNIDTHDKMPTTGGSLALKDSFPAEDSVVTAKLKEAGAVILGKTNLSEWPILDPLVHQVDGAVLVDKQKILMRLTETHVALVLVRGLLFPLIFVLLLLAQKQTGL